jgi:hypothetical protein
MADRLNPFSDLPVVTPVLAAHGMPAPRMVFRVAPHLASDMALGEGRELPDLALTGVED